MSKTLRLDERGIMMALRALSGWRREEEQLPLARDPRIPVPLLERILDTTREARALVRRRLRKDSGYLPRE